MTVHGNPGTGVAEGMQAVGSYQGETGVEIGFVHREAEIPMYQYLAPTTYAYVVGQIITLYNNGDFWALFAAGATVGQKVFANYKDGSAYAAATGTSTQTATSSSSSLANTGVLTVGGTFTGSVNVGDVWTDTASGQAFAILQQLSGTANGAGTYQTSLVGVTISATAFTAAGSVETAFFVDSPAAAGELAKITTWG